MSSTIIYFIRPLSSSSPMNKWRVVHVCLYLVALGGCFSAILPFYHFKAAFEGWCPLYADVVVEQLNDSYQFVLDISFENRTIWGSTEICDFCLFTPVVCFIYAFVWGWFFFLCSGNGRLGIWEPWRLIVPAAIFTLVTAIVMFIAATLMTQGMMKFCEGFQKNNLGGCSTVQYLNCSTFSKLHGFYYTQLRSEISIWIGAFAWGVGSLALFVRCCCGADFKHPLPKDEDFV